MTLARTRGRLAPLATLLCLIALMLAGVSEAFAADRKTEALARGALKKAELDSLTWDYDRAISRLQKALTACGTVRCSKPTRAALMRDVGVMQFKKGNAGDASKSFAAARKLDRRVALNPAYDQADIRAAWEGGGPTATPSADSDASQPSGDFSHAPAAEQAVRTPIPVYVEYPGSARMATVVLKYRGPQMSSYKRVDMSKLGDGWGGLIPCGDVTEGVMRYYIQGFDSDNTPFANSGDPKHPFTVPVRTAITSAPPNLPGRPPPHSCEEEGPQESADETARDEGEACDENAQCKSGDCTDHHCAPEAKGAPRSFVRFWIGISGSFDLTQLPSDDNVCKLTQGAVPANASNYYCTDPVNNSDFPTRASPVQNASLLDGGHTDGGFVGGNVRVMATLDYAATGHLLVGARLGYVAGTYHGQAATHFVPVHLEARGTWVFGDEPLSHSGFAPLVFLAAGAAEFDASSTVPITQKGVGGSRPMQAWKIGGPLFVAAGGGARYAFSPRWAFNAALKFSGAIGNGFMPSIAPELGLQYGF